jgi:hypothetical protein
LEFFPSLSSFLFSLFFSSSSHREQGPNRTESAGLSSSYSPREPPHPVAHPPPSAPPHPHPLPLSFPTLPSSTSSPNAPAMELHHRPWPPPMEGSNQGCFYSWDNQDGCTQPPSCNPHRQFYPKPTLISRFRGILFFN